MTKFYKNSSAIKTVFVGIILASTSISSASHAEYILTTAVTQGLESQLSLENPQIIAVMQLLEQGNCQNPQDPVPVTQGTPQSQTDRVIADLESSIKGFEELLKKAKAEKAVFEKQIKELEKQKKAILDGLSRFTEEQYRDELRKVQPELQKINAEITKLKLDMMPSATEVESLERSIKMYKDLLKKAKECFKEPKKTMQQR